MDRERQRTILWWGHRTEKIYSGWGEHSTYYLDWVNNKGKRKKLGGQFESVLSENNTTLWLHLSSWNLPDSQLSSEFKMEPSVAIHSVTLPQST